MLYILPSIHHTKAVNLDDITQQCFLSHPQIVKNTLNLSTFKRNMWHLSTCAALQTSWGTEELILTRVDVFMSLTPIFRIIPHTCHNTVEQKWHTTLCVKNCLDEICTSAKRWWWTQETSFICPSNTSTIMGHSEVCNARKSPFLNLLFEPIQSDKYIWVKR